MSQSTQLSTIQFHNQTLITFEQDNVQYVAMRPICENIGLEWSSQLQRLKRDEVLNSTVFIINTVAQDGKEREVISLPIEYLNGWLFGIDVKRVKPEIRDLLITYKKECYKALADYWMKGKAERQPLALPKPEKKYTFEFTEYEIQLLLWLWFSNYNTHELLDILIEPLEYIGSRYASTVYSHKTEYARFIDESVEIIYRLTKDFHKSRDENWVNPLSGVRSVIFHQKEMRKKHEAKVKKAEEKRFPHTNF